MFATTALAPIGASLVNSKMVSLQRKRTVGQIEISAPKRKRDASDPTTARSKTSGVGRIRDYHASRNHTEGGYTARTARDYHEGLRRDPTSHAFDLPVISNRPQSSPRLLNSCWPILAHLRCNRFFPACLSIHGAIRAGPRMEPTVCVASASGT
jgi:hypothetical protein